MNLNIKKRLAVVLLLLLSSSQLFAQPGLPGDCEDADACDVPLDNWLIILVVGGLILTTVYLHNKQKKEAIA
jgi:hypothetical protein